MVETGARIGPALRQDTLVRLRWLAVAGQALAVFFVYGALGFALPIVACSTLILLSAALNLVLRLRYPPTHRLDERSATVYLAYDVLQLSALLYLTGGLANPFAFLLLAPVMVSATILPLPRTLFL